MSAAYVKSDGVVVQLDARTAPDVVVTAEDVQDAEKLSRMVQSLQREVAALKREWRPKRMYFRDLSVTATTSTVIRLEHGFSGLVNWWIVRWDASVAGTAPRIDESSETDQDTLCVVSGAAGTATICVEAAG